MSDSVTLTPEVSVFTCPQCHAVVKAGETACPVCAVNLAWAAVLAERRVLASVPETTGAPYVADIIFPRFGEFLVKNEYITELQLQTALAHQREASLMGMPRTIGQILYEMGAVTREQLDLASIEQVKQLQTALQDNNRQLEQRVTQRTQELQAALQKLAELSELKSTLAANIAHELRQPIVPIKGYAALLTSGRMGELNPKQREAMENIERSIGRLENTLIEMVQFAASVGGQMPLHRVSTRLADLVERLEAFHAPRAAEAQVHLRFELAPDLPNLVVDVDKIRWALSQLLDNAIKFTPAGGTVTLIAQSHADQVSLAVQDTGTGLPTEVLAQLDQATEGGELGLALVKQIIEAHQAQLVVETRPGAGSRFAFDLEAKG